MKEILTSSGLALQMDEDVFNDMEVLEALVAVERGDVSSLPAVISRIFGDDKKRFYDSLRNDKGRVPIDAAMTEIKGIIAALGAKNA